MIILIFTIPVCSADIVEDVLNLKYIDSMNELESGTIYHPNVTTQSQGHISGWIDIVGYHNLSFKDNKYFIHGNPVDQVIIKYSVWSDNYDWNCDEDYIEVTDNSSIIEGTSIISKIDIHLRWYKSTLSARTVCGLLGCRIVPHIKKNYHDEYFTITDTDVLPTTYPEMNIENTSIEVVIYNNTISPKTTINIINIPANILRVDYYYNNSTITHYYATATQEYTDKNCPYMNLNDVDTWKKTGDISQFNNVVIIPSMNFSKNDLKVVINNPYTSHEIENMNISECQYRGVQDTFSSLFYGILVIVGIFGMGIMYQVKRLKK